MAEYIEREALMRFPIRRDHYDRKNGNKHFINGIESILEYAEYLPAADVAPVVRCKDCKNAYINSFAAASGVALCRFWSNRLKGETAVVQQNDFCSYGERRTEK